MKITNYYGRIYTDKIDSYLTNDGNIITLYLVHMLYPEELGYFYELKINSAVENRYLAGNTFAEAVETMNILIEYM